MSVNKKVTIIISIAIIILSVPLAASATVIDKISKIDLSLRAGAVYFAQVYQVDPLYGLNSTGEPFTKINLSVTDVIFGDVSENAEYSFFLPEGNFEPFQFLVINGTAKFDENAEYLILHRAGEWYQSPVLGWSNGYFKVVYDFYSSKDILLHTSGGCFMGINDSGIVISTPFMESPSYVIGSLDGNLIYETENNNSEYSSYFDSNECLSRSDSYSLLREIFGLNRPQPLAFNSSLLSPTSFEVEELNFEQEGEAFMISPICLANPQFPQCQTEGIVYEYE